MNEKNSRNSVDRLRVGMAQIAPVWLQRESTLEKIASYTRSAADAGCRLVDK